MGALTPQPCSERRRKLEGMKLDGSAWTTSETFDDGRALFTAVCELGFEGVVAKNHSSLYRPKDRGWVKVKNPNYWRRDAEIEAMARKHERRRTFRTARTVGSAVAFERVSHDWNASLEALALFRRVRGRKVHVEVGELDALRGKADHSRRRTDPRDERLILLLWSPSERFNGVQDRGFDARVCEIVRRPVRVFENVMQDGGAQLGLCRIGADCLRDVKRVSQVELAPRISMVAERTRGD